MQAPDGNTMPVVGTYEQIQPPDFVVYTWQFDVPGMDGDEPSLVRVDFRDAGEDRTEVVITHSRRPESHRPEPYRMGWEGGLDKVEALFARQA